MTQSDISIIQKLYDFYRLFYEQIDNFPKKSREILVTKVERLVLDLLELMFTAEYSPTNLKIQYLEKANIKLDFTKTINRLMFDLKIINQTKYIEMEGLLVEIGKMLGGWIKYLKGRADTTAGQ